MGISAHDRARYARHLLLPQLGEAGQARLLATTLGTPPDADQGALAVAARYLTRAGVCVEVAKDMEATSHEAVGGSLSLRVPDSDEITRIAGRPALIEAARALAGALAAVNAIKEAARIEARPESPIPAISSEEA